MEKLETNIITPKRNTSKDADIIEDLEIMAQSIQAEFNKKADNSITEDFDKKLKNKVDKEQGKGLSTNDFTNLLKEKLENLENYNDTEIRNLLNSSLKGVNYTASNGMLTFTKNDGSTISVDLPLELLIESGRYDEANKQIVLVLANGNSINIPVSSLLDDFYGKSETYNKTEVDTIIAEKQALIDKLEEENQKQQEELDILNSEYTEKELEGESVVISNGLPKSKIKADINGNSYQEITEGYNRWCFPIGYKETKNGVTVEATKEGVRVYGTPTITSGLVTFYSGNQLLLEKGQTYTIVTDKKIVGIGFSSNMLTPNGMTNLTMTETKTNKTATETVGETVTPSINVRYDVGTIDYTFKLMFYEGEYDANKPYEPYTNGVASPSTEYKQDIEVIDNGYNEFNINAVVQGDLDTNTGEKINDATSIQHSEYMEVDSNESYTITFNNTLTKRIFLLDKDKKVINTNTTTKDVFNFNTGNTTKYFRVKIVGTFDEKTQMVKGTGEKPYLPYGHIGLIQRGKNKYKDYEQGYISNDNGTTSSTLLAYVTDYIPIKNNIVYLVNEKFESSLEDAWAYRLGLYDKNKKWLSNTAITTKDFSKVLDENVAFIRVSTASSINDTQYVSFIDNQYEPYIEPIVHEIDLAGEKLAKVGEIADLLNIGVDGSCEIKKNTVMDKYGENALKANIEFIINQGDYTLFQFVSKVALDKAIPILSNRFRYAENWGVDVESVYIGGLTNKRIQCKILTSRLSENSLDGLINWIRENPLEFLYSAPNYETIKLPSIEPITLFEGTNVFELVANLGTTLAVTYKVSNKKKILSLEERISALESAVIGG